MIAAFTHLLRCEIIQAAKGIGQCYGPLGPRAAECDVWVRVSEAVVVAATGAATVKKLHKFSMLLRLQVWV